MFLETARLLRFWTEDGLNLLPAAATNDHDPGEGVMNNSSLLTADRTTHLKIVVLALVCATLVAGLGVVSRITDSGMIGPTGASRRPLRWSRSASP